MQLAAPCGLFFSDQAVLKLVVQETPSLNPQFSNLAYLRKGKQ